MHLYDFKKYKGYGSTSQRSRDRMVVYLQSQGIENKKVLEVMANTPRHCFVDSAFAHQAYDPVSLPILGGQTISQPFAVAQMTAHLLDNAVCFDRVLEIGTGCGYQSLILTQCFKEVFSIERVRELFEFSQKMFKQFGTNNIHTHYGDGHQGWPEDLAFDAIIFTAAANEVPPAILNQMNKKGAVLIAPLNSIEQSQYLVSIVLDRSGLHKKVVGPAYFVPMRKGFE